MSNKMHAVNGLCTPCWDLFDHEQCKGGDCKCENMIHRRKDRIVAIISHKERRLISDRSPFSYSIMFTAQVSSLRWLGPSLRSDEDSAGREAWRLAERPTVKRGGFYE
jgi:hypothetical protein